MALPIRVATILLLLLYPLADGSLLAQQMDEHMSALTTGHQHDRHDHGARSGATSWEGSPAGKAYSEFNHHLAGVFVIVMGLTELRTALGIVALPSTRFLLPGAMLLAGVFLVIWSDHEAWPIGSLSLAQTLFGGDWEMLQHKLYGLLLLGVGAIESVRRSGRLSHRVWRHPLPALAIVGGFALFLHSHGAHPAAHEIAVHHAVMGGIALTAGTSKLVSHHRDPTGPGFSHWELLWASFILLIGIQLLIYSE